MEIDESQEEFAKIKADEQILCREDICRMFDMTPEYITEEMGSNRHKDAQEAMIEDVTLHSSLYFSLQVLKLQGSIILD